MVTTWQRPDTGRTIRVVSLNIAHGRGSARHQALVRKKDIEGNLDAIARFLAEVKADVAALQEVDVDCTWSGRFSHLDHLARKSGLTHTLAGIHTRVRRRPLGPLRYGTALLSRHPIVGRFNHGFNRRITGRKGFCAATIQVGAFDLDVVSLHLDFARSGARSRQIRSMISILEVLGRERPMVLAGDFNACAMAEYPLFRTLHAWRGLKKMPFLFADTATYPSSRPRHAIDHIWATPELRFRSFRVHPVRLSDHLPSEAVLEVA